jgi:molybdate-binding protein
VGRDEGSGARRLQDRLLAGRTSREARAFVASDHRGVVETIRTGWAQAGVCVELAAVEGGLEFLPLHEEDYDLVFSCTLEDDPRIVALIDVLRGRSFARLLSALPGYDASRTGDLS